MPSVAANPSLSGNNEDDGKGKNRLALGLGGLAVAAVGVVMMSAPLGGQQIKIPELPDLALCAVKGQASATKAACNAALELCCGVIIDTPNMTPGKRACYTVLSRAEDSLSPTCLDTCNAAVTACGEAARVLSGME